MARPTPAKKTSNETAEPFPFDVVRDLLGICRAIALATPIENRARRARLREVGDTLVRALELAHRYDGSSARGDGSWGGFAARNMARDATRRLGDEIGALMPAAPVLVAAEARIAWPTRRKMG